MKFCLGIATILLSCGMLLAQTSASSQAGTQSQQGQTAMPRMQAHMQQMQAQLQQMQTQVSKMRSDAEKIQDPNTKAAMLDNVQMWEQYTNQMQSRMNMMQQAHERRGKKGGPGAGQPGAPPQQ